MELGSIVNPVLLSLETLRESIPPPRKARFASTLRDMTDVTGFITSHMYAPNIPSVSEAELRKEIRATKGLLLNRYGSLWLFGEKQRFERSRLPLQENICVTNTCTSFDFRICMTACGLLNPAVGLRWNCGWHCETFDRWRWTGHVGFGCRIRTAEVDVGWNRVIGAPNGSAIPDLE